MKALNQGWSSGAVFRSTHRCPSLPVTLPVAYLYCSSELSSLHVKGVNRLMLPCQQALRSSLKPVQWPWILFNSCSPCLAKIIQLSKIKTIFFFPCTIKNVGLLFFKSKSRGIFQGGILEKKKKNNENFTNFAAKGNRPLSPGRSFIHFWHCHAYRWSAPPYTWLIAVRKMKRDSLH